MVTLLHNNTPTLPPKPAAIAGIAYRWGFPPLSVAIRLSARYWHHKINCFPLPPPRPPPPTDIGVLILQNYYSNLTTVCLCVLSTPTLVIVYIEYYVT